MGLAALFGLVPWLYAAMKLGGAAYLIYLAISMWRSARQPLDAAPGRAQRQAFRNGVIVNLANPKSVLFAGAVIVVIFPAGLSATDSLLIVANHFAVEICVYSAMAFCLSTAPARAAYLRIKTHADRIAACILAALGLRLLLER
jgi:threonine/homoserine/homoserine lactone efflux protein